MAKRLVADEVVDYEVISSGSALPRRFHELEFAVEHAERLALTNDTVHVIERRRVRVYGEPPWGAW